MEFGSSSRVDSGAKNVIGLAWTSAPATPDEVNQLITTTDSRVTVHIADDLRLVSSWVSRPGSLTKFTLAAVQNRQTRRFYCVQDGDRLVSWHEKDSSLDAAASVALRGEAFALRTSPKVRLLLVVYKDGGISAFHDASLEEILFLPPGAPDGTAVTWTRFARSPTNDAQFLLTTLRQPVPGAAASAAAATAAAPAAGGKGGGKKGKGASTEASSTAAAAATEPYMTVLTITVSRPQPTKGQPSSSAAAAAGAGGGETYTFKHAATHRFAPPAGASAGALIASVTLHKFLHALTLVWTSGHMQVLQHGHASGDWYATPPRQTVLRQLARFLPADAAAGDDGAAPAPRGSFTCATFALEPSCVVVAGSDGSSLGGDGVGLTVWDVRYGVVLGAKRLRTSGDFSDDAAAGAAAADDDEDDEEAAPRRGGKRGRKAAAPAAAAAPPAGRERSGSSASGVGSLLSAAHSLAASVVTPDSVFQVTVNEDSSFVAVASRRRVIITPVAARGASLLSAVGKADASSKLLAAPASAATAAGEGSAVVAAPVALAPGRTVTPVAVVNLGDCIRSATGGGSAAALEPADVAAAVQQAVRSAVAIATSDVSDACAAVLAPSATPSAADVLAVLASGKPPAAPVVAAPSAAGKAAASKAGSKRKRTEESEAAAAAAPPAVASTSLDASVSPALVSAALYRCVAELRAQRRALHLADPEGEGDDGGATDDGAAASSLDVPAVLAPLLASGLVSHGGCPDLVATLLGGACARPTEAAAAGSKGGKKGGSSKKEVDEDAAAALRAAQDAHAVSCLCLLAGVLGAVADLPEGWLVRALADSLHAVKAAHLAALWRAVQDAERGAGGVPAVSTAFTVPAVPAQAAAARGRHMAAVSAAAATRAGPRLPPSVLGQLYLTSCVVGAPRNDVFAEAGLARGLPAEDAAALLAALYRLLTAHATASTKATSAVGGGSAAPSLSSLSASSAAALPPQLRLLPLRLPSYGQVLDWVRMTLDAHFARLLLLARAPAGSSSSAAAATVGGPAVAGLLRELVDAVTREVGTAEALAGLRGHVQHVLTRGPPPPPPPAVHIVDYVTL